MAESKKTTRRKSKPVETPPEEKAPEEPGLDTQDVDALNSTMSELLKDVDASGMNLGQRIALARSLIPTIKKDKTVGRGDHAYKIATHEAVNAVAKPIMCKCGLIDYVSLKSTDVIETGMYQGSVDKNRKVYHIRSIYEYTIENMDNPEEKRTIDVEGWGEDASDKGPGKAQTYAMKYGRSKLLAISTGDDEEGRNPDDQIVAKPAITVTPEQISALLERADDYFGEADSTDQLSRMCNKVFSVSEVRAIPRENFQQAMNLLENQAIRLGKIDAPAKNSDDIED